MMKRSYLILATILLFCIVVGGVYVWMRYQPSLVQLTNSNESVLPTSEADVQIQDPLYYLAKARPYVQELQGAIVAKNYTLALEINQKIASYLLKMKQVTILPVSQEQVQFLLDATEYLGQALQSGDAKLIQEGVKRVSMLSILQFQSKRSDLQKEYQ